MDDETLTQLKAQLAKLDTRLTKIEAEQVRPWVAWFKNAGIIVGCVGGIIGGLATLYNSSADYFAEPKITVTSGGDFTIYRDPNGNQALVEYGLTVENTGKALDTLSPDEPSILLHPEKGTPVDAKDSITVRSLRLLQAGQPSDDPFSVKPQDAKNFRIRLELTQADLDTLLADPGLHSIKISLRSNKSKKEPYSSQYCFYVGENVAEVIRSEGSYLTRETDFSCPGR